MANHSTDVGNTRNCDPAPVPIPVSATPPRRRYVVVAIVLVFVVLLLTVAAGLVRLVMGGLEDSSSDRAVVLRAERHLVRASASIDDGWRALDFTGLVPDTEGYEDGRSKAYESAWECWQEAREALDDAWQVAEGITDDELRETYLKMLDERYAALDSCDGLLKAFEETDLREPEYTDMLRHRDAGQSALHAASERIALGLFDQGVAEARGAIEHFEGIRGIVEKQQHLKSTGRAAYVRYVDARVLEAQVLVEAAGYGVAGDLTSFTSARDRYDTIRMSNVSHCFPQPDHWYEGIYDDVVRLREHHTAEYERLHREVWARLAGIP